MFLEPAYRLIQLIGSSEFTQTFIAVDEKDYPFVACVVQKIRLRSQSGILDASQSGENQNLARKISLLQQLEKYCLFPKLLSSHYEDNYIYLVFEYVEGKNLNKLLSEQGKLTEIQVWQLLTDVLPAINLLHSYDLIHCDIKPSNIIYNPNSHQQKFILVDFASACIFDKIYLSVDNNLITGNPEYIAPEQLNSQPIFSSDLYSLGVTCIYLLTQVSPFYLFDSANNQWVWRDYLQTGISARIGNILDKLIHKDINYRFQSTQDVMEAMGIDYTSIKSSFKLKSQTKNNEYPKLASLHTLTSQISLASEVNTVAIHPHNHILASGHNNKNIYLWDLQTKQFLQSISGHSQAVESVCFSPDVKILASASNDKTIKLWDTNNYQEIITLIGHTKAVKSVVFSPDSKYLVSGSWDKTVKIWDVETGTKINTLTGHKQQVSAVAFSPDGLYVASASFDKTVCIWKLEQALSSKAKIPSNPASIISGHTWAVLAVAFSPNGEILATGSDDNTIKLWEIKTGQEIATLSGHSWSITGLIFDFTGEFLISSSKDKTIKIWRVSNQEEIITLCQHEDSVTAITANFNTQSDMPIIASGSQDKTIKICQLEFGS
ncbi:serine/threonine protein kinase [Brunnivagina elsteri CCALA 953]|uniref:Serine/threonine protein kinase n=2 Tax=Brunnivagina TaxID=3344733 RepID=A0A2A2TDA8_9CYAN|nr:serine/threonine protein kinase [Calothrix elsteri CCALA 953]